MSSFFTAPSSQKKRKRSELAGRSGESLKRRIPNGVSKPNGLSKSSSHQAHDDESISGSDSDISSDDLPEVEEQELSSSEEEAETDAERRLRLAERYLDNIKQELAQDGAEDPTAFDAAEVDRDLIAARLREDVAESKGKVYRHIASQLNFPGAWKSRTAFRADQLGLTAVAVVPPFGYTVGKDRSICKWEIPPTRRLQIVEASQPTNITPRSKPRLVRKYTCQARCKDAKKHPGHIGEILCLAASPSGKLLATGGSDRRVVIWDATTLTPIKAFANQHRDAVLGLSFRRHNPDKGPQTLYSCSADRTIKIWSLEGDKDDTSQMTYTETLFGHEDKIVDVVGLAGEKCISVGARDRSARLWKVVEESQLVFRGGGITKRGDGEDSAYAEGSIDQVAMVDEDTFVTGGDNGSISLWSVFRKKPIFTIPLAHGADPPPTLKESYGPESEEHERQGRAKARWITALASVPYSDLVLSGSWDGSIRAWKVTEDKRRIEPIGILGGTYESISFEDEIVVNRNGINGHQERKPLRGVINGISVYERGDRGKDGLVVFAAIAKTHRLGRYNLMAKSKDEGVLFMVDRIP